jgi:hypothetical protein
MTVNAAGTENTTGNDGVAQPNEKPSFTAADADAAFAAYNKTFCVVENGKGYYKEDESGGTNHFWTQAEEIEMIIDTWERTRSPDTKTLIDQSINGLSGISEPTGCRTVTTTTCCGWSSPAAARFW